MMEQLLDTASQFFQKQFDGVIRIEIEEEKSSIWVDGHQQPPMISLHAPKGLNGSFCLWQTNSDTLSRLFGSPPQQLESVFIAGRLKISGDMSVMGRLESFQE
ncbi:MAG: SCP2 sterol-binding domain-containing protein [bacterium]